MESQANVTKSAVAEEQMPTQPPNYPGPPRYETAQYSGTVVTVQPVAAPIIIASSLGSEPASVVCSACNERIVTRVVRSVGVRTHVIAGILCLVGCWPCVPIPYCTNVCKKAIHFCPNCNAYVGAQM